MVHLTSPQIRLPLCPVFPRSDKSNLFRSEGDDKLQIPARASAVVLSPHVFDDGSINVHHSLCDSVEWLCEGHIIPFHSCTTFVLVTYASHIHVIDAIPVCRLAVRNLYSYKFEVWLCHLTISLFTLNPPISIKLPTTCSPRVIRESSSLIS